jgi:hypothetical protein
MASKHRTADVIQRTELTRHLPTMAGIGNKAICLKFSFAEGDAMTGIEYLLDQARRAERLAKHALDALTVNRLASFAAECRQEVKDLHATETTPDPVGLPEPRNDLGVHAKDR